ncbi:MAG TPA: PilZ domain-containing protein [Candidatus Aquilonibacter sp.]|nr:PilZ domain-containing protein [Candidatus Aquilonibacter sp.]
MTHTSLLVCADEASVTVLRRVLEELQVLVEVCPNIARAQILLAQKRFDLVILDGPSQADTIGLLHETRGSRLNDSTLTVAIVPGQESIHEMFSLGVNFVLYKPVLYERALSSLRAAQSLLRKDKRRKTRSNVHTHATIDYAGAEQAKATLVDLAEDGMAVHFVKQLPPTCKVYFQFQLPGQTADVRLSGQVVWQDWNGRAGIQFVDVPQASRRILQQWLTASMADGAQPETVDLSSHVEHTLTSGQDYSRSKPTEHKPKKTDEAEASARLRSGPGNRRGKERYACRVGAEVYKTGTSVRNYCHLTDLSQGGCYLEMPLAFPAGTAVEITVRTHDMKLRLAGEVRTSHPGYGMGILFKLNTKDERAGVQSLIDFVAATAESSS